MYSKSISSEDPVLIVLLVDQSGSMHESWGVTKEGESLARSAKIAVNKALYDLALNACVTDVGIKDRVHISAFTYADEHHSDESDWVRWALHGLGQGNGWVEADRWVTGYDYKEKVAIADDGGRPINMDLPIWIEEGARGGTPMCTAFSKAAQVVRLHNQEYPDSHPPIVINITDGMPTDTRYDQHGLGQEDWSFFRSAASEITSQKIEDGNALLMNIHITNQGGGDEVLTFPVKAPSGSSEHAKQMLEVSSVLPANMVVQARAQGYDLREGSKAFVMNGDRALLSGFLKIGTTMKTDGRMGLLEA